MKILAGIDVPFHPFGGSLLTVNDWYSNLPADVEALFVTMPPTNPLYQDWWTIPNVRFLQTAKEYYPAHYGPYIASLKAELGAIIAEYRPDVIHAHHLNFGLSRAFAEAAPQIPKLGICHGTDVQWAMKEPLLRDNLHAIASQLDLLLFPAERMAEDFFAVYPERKPYAVAPHGIPDKYYKQELIPPGYDGHRPLRVLYAGRLLTLKGAHIAVEAMRDMRGAAELTVIGNEDEKGYKAQLVANTMQGRLPVTFLDQLPRDELIAAFARFDVIVFPSVAVEAYCLTAIEAQANGLPVVYSPAGGIADTLQESALKIKPNTPQQLSLVLRRICRKPGLLLEYQQRGQRNAERFRQSHCRERIFAITRELIASER